MPLYVAEIIENREVATDYLELCFVWEGPKPEPGQFFTVRVEQSPAPLLRRPFGFSSYAIGESDLPARDKTTPRPTASTIYWRRGPATRLIAGRKPGDTIEILGPLGTPFPEPAPGSHPVLVAGGVGVGPILFLADELAASDRPATLIIGARSADGLPRQVSAPGTDLHYATDDGSLGETGTSIDLLERLLEGRTTSSGPIELFLCGPEPMLEAGYHAGAKYGLRTWVAMEQTMGCAVGACMGCAIPLVAGPDRYARVCTEGPVFDATQIDWEALRG